MLACSPAHALPGWKPRQPTAPTLRGSLPTVISDDVPTMGDGEPASSHGSRFKRALLHSEPINSRFPTRRESAARWTLCTVLDETIVSACFKCKVSSPPRPPSHLPPVQLRLPWRHAQICGLLPAARCRRIPESFCPHDDREDEESRRWAPVGALLALTNQAGLPANVAETLH